MASNSNPHASTARPTASPVEDDVQPCEELIERDDNIGFKSGDDKTNDQQTTLTLCQDVLELHEARSKELLIKEPDRNRISSWLEKIEVNKQNETSESQQYVVPVVNVKGQDSARLFTVMGSKTKFHNLPLVKSGNEKEDRLLSTNARERRESSALMQSMLHQADVGGVLERVGMSRGGRYRSSLDRRENEAFDKISILDIEDVHATPSVHQIKTAIRNAAMKEASSKDEEENKAKSMAESDTARGATGVRWRALTTDLQTLNKDDNDWQETGAGTEERSALDRLRDKVQSQSSNTQGKGLKAVINFRNLAKIKRSKAAQNLDSFAKDAEHAKFIQKIGEDIRYDIPLPTKMEIYDFVIPVLEDTVKVYRRTLGSDHDSTKEVRRRLEEVRHLKSEAGLFYRPENETDQEMRSGQK